MTSQPPDAVRAAALAALRGRTRSTVVAELMSDDAMETGLSRRFTFSAPGWDVAVETRWMGEAYAAAVAVAPARPFGVTVYVADPTPHAVSDGSASHSGSGAVEIDSLPAGPCMLLLTSAGGSVETEWVTLLHPDATA